jgi:hypothetical protein
MKERMKFQTRMHVAANNATAAPVDQAAAGGATAAPAAGHMECAWVSGNSTGGGNGTGACGGGNGTNVQGKIGAKNVTVNTPPFTVESCQQVVYIEAKTLSDSEDCESLIPAYFTMNMYYVNFLSSNNATTLKKSIRLDNIGMMPSVLPGTKKKCIDFKQNDGVRFGICMGTPEAAASILDVYESFMRCRMGDSLGPMTPEKLHEMFLRNCGGNKLDKSGSTAEAAHRKKMNALFKNGKVNPYYGTLTPGQPHKEIKDDKKKEE